ncbi:hypothetical protein BH09GEM1_BH09GEM1_25960 [soil metagenome]
MAASRSNALPPSDGIAGTLYVAVALMWLVSDRRIARVLAHAAEDG